MLPSVVAPASHSSYSPLKLIHNKQMHGSSAKTHPSFGERTLVSVAARDLQETLITPVSRQMFCTDTSVLHNTHISNVLPHGVHRRYSNAVYTTSQRRDINHHLPCFQAASD